MPSARIQDVGILPVDRCSDGKSKQSTHVEVPQSPPFLRGYLYMLYPHSDGEIWGSEILGGDI